MKTLLTLLIVSCLSPAFLFAQNLSEDDLKEYEKTRLELLEAKKRAADDPVIRNKRSAPILAYQIEQRRRFEIEQRYLKNKSNDKSDSIGSVIAARNLKKLEERGLIKVYFERRYNYKPWKGLVGYVEDAYLIETLDKDNCLIKAADEIVWLKGVDTTELPTGAFLELKALLIGPIQSYQSVRGKMAVFTATEVDLEKHIGPQKDEF